MNPKATRGMSYAFLTTTSHILYRIVPDHLRWLEGFPARCNLAFRQKLKNELSHRHAYEDMTQNQPV